MKKSNVTQWICDQCGKVVITEAYSSASPEGWFWFHEYRTSNYIDISFRHHDKDQSFEVDMRKGHFCSSKCLLAAFTEELLNNLAAEIENIKQDEANSKVILGGEAA